MSDKNKPKFSGPMGVGETLEEVKSVNIYEFLQKTEQYSELTKDLKEEQLKEVNKEVSDLADSYQVIVEKVTEALSDPKSQKLFMQMLQKRAGIK